MKKLLALLALLGAIFAPSFASAQAARDNICYFDGTSGIFNNATCIPAGTSNPFPILPFTAGAAVTAANPLPVTVGGATGFLPTKVCDATSITTCATVKAASTPSVATDTSLVVQLNPNSPGIAAPGQTTKAASLSVTIASDQWAASGTAASGNPELIGAVAQSSEAVVTAGQAAQLVTDLAKKLIVLPYANPENFVSGVITSAMTGTTSTSLIAAPASGLRNYITQCTFSNSHATVGTMMILQDGSGGTTIYSAPAAPAFGGATITFPTPLRQPTTATALFVQNVTTGSNTFAACSGYKGA
jgi:hypothetical protein